VRSNGVAAMTLEEHQQDGVRVRRRGFLSAVTVPLRLAGRAVGWVLIALVRCYQLCVSPLLPRVCRFEPSCSRYMIEAIRKRGPVVGVLKGLWRLVRCNPFCPGGYDPVEEPPSPDSHGGRRG